MVAVLAGGRWDVQVMRGMGVANGHVRVCVDAVVFFFNSGVSGLWRGLSWPRHIPAEMKGLTLVSIRACGKGVR